MTGLNTGIHLEMLEVSRREQSLARRLVRAVRAQFSENWVYGLEWGDPDQVQPLQYVRDNYVLPFVRPDHKALEIGPGGGRWTRYLLSFDTLYVVDFYDEVLQELRRKVHRRNMVFIKNDGTSVPEIPARSLDYVFSFGTFVHLDKPIIEAYLANLKPLLRSTATVVIHYSDKSKVMAQENPKFAQNSPPEMRAMVREAGYAILEEDTTTMWHSSIICFGPPRGEET